MTLTVLQATFENFGGIAAVNATVDINGHAVIFPRLFVDVGYALLAPEVDTSSGHLMLRFDQWRVLDKSSALQLPVTCYNQASAAKLALDFEQDLTINWTSTADQILQWAHGWTARVGGDQR